jgi:valyl-tRNA synthetase
LALAWAWGVPAPYLPFATEEVWRWTHDTSVHTAAWPSADELGISTEPTGLFSAVSLALISIRRAKTDAKASQKTEVSSATLAGPTLISAAIDDLKAVGRIHHLTIVEAEEIQVRDIVLVEVPVDGSA